MLNRDLVAKTAMNTGFDLCGVASCVVLDKDGQRLEKWLTTQCDSSLGYMGLNLDKRSDVKLLVEGAKSVIVCAVSYNYQQSSSVASYALATDYHYTIKQMLFTLLNTLQTIYPTLHGRAFVDSAPIFEKRFAAEAGLGAVGRNSLIINPVFGSKILLGELVVDLATDIYDTPQEWDCCKGCRRCIDSCPSGAIMEDRTIDTKRCISCMTIEKAVGQQIEGWVFGCDVCQNVCPHNANAERLTNQNFMPIITEQQAYDAIIGGVVDQKVMETPLCRAIKTASKIRNQK